MALINKKANTNDENNCDVIEFDFGNPAVYFNWICVSCKGKACDGTSLEMQFLGDNSVYLDSDGSYWFCCENCTTSIHAKCLGFVVNVEFFQKYGQIVKCC